MLSIPLIDERSVVLLREKMAELPFEDGKATAKGRAAEVKSNRQADGADPRTRALGKAVHQSLGRHRTFQAYARPANYSAILFSRYAVGETYGLHTDNAMMTDVNGRPMRSDLSFTLFLSDPAAYEGGELSIEGLAGVRRWKPPAGTVVVYGTGEPHRVMPVTSGERWAAVGWVQSLVRRDDQREVLFDLSRIPTDGLAEEHHLILQRVFGSLQRMWNEV